MNYTFNKKLVEQLRNGEICTYFNREKDSLEMLQALLSTAFPKDNTKAAGKCKYYWGADNSILWCADDGLPWNLPPIPLSNFVQPEQSERDVMAELDALHKKYEQLKELADEMYETLMPIQYEGNIAIEPSKQSETKWTPKVGEWFKVEFGGLYYCTISDENGVFGDNQNGGTVGCGHDHVFNKPTDKEVEDYMVGLAKEKYPVGTKFKSVVSEDEYVSTDYFYFHKNYLFANNGAIWYNGKWAEIVNPVRWRAEKGQYYYTIASTLYPVSATELYDGSDNKRYNCGNYFQTAQQAEEMAVLMQFTLNNHDKVKQLMDKKE